MMFKPVYTDKQKSRIEELVTLLNDYTKLYDEGKPAISDKEWVRTYYDRFVEPIKDDETISLYVVRAID